MLIPLKGHKYLNTLNICEDKKMLNSNINNICVQKYTRRIYKTIFKKLNFILENNTLLTIELSYD